jgi:AcrR family transcriptional regulator
VNVSSPKTRPRGRPPSPRNRERILDAALRLFAEKGYGETSVANVQEACGLSRESGALYKHFASKEKLLEAGIERELVHLEGVRVAFRLLGDAGTFTEELEILGRFLLVELLAERDLLRILLKDLDRFPKLLSRAREQLIEPAYAEFAAWLRRHADAGHVRCDDPDATAAVALGAIVQYRAIEALLGSPPNVDEERFLRQWVRMVGAAVT